MKGIKQIFDFEDRFAKISCEQSQNLLKGDKDVLARELASEKNYPEFINTNFGLLIGEIRALNQAQKFVQNLIQELRDDFDKLLKSKSFDEFIGNFTDVFEIEELKKLPDVVRDVIDMQVGLVVSFAAAAKNFGGFDINDYRDSFNQYFFSEKGFQTVSGDLVIRPKLPRLDVEHDLQTIDSRIAAERYFKTIGNQINAERYIRDMIRIIVETGGDSLHGTRDRYRRLKEKYGDDESKKKLVAWFDSFGDMAEASLLPVVEEILNGAVGVELNPLIAASIGTFCSVVTRKATEHSYLTLLEIS